jgi:hypothetical protein
MAQTTSSTLPKGWDTTEGKDAYGATPANSSFWANFDLGTTSTATYNPAKTLAMYDSSLFSWNNATGTVITKISFRRDGVTSNAATGHKKQWVVIMSTSSAIPASANFNDFDDNHGSNRTVVFGTAAAPKDVTFPATNKPTSGTAAFNVVVTLDKPFVVPAKTKTLCIEIRSYKVTGATKGWWRADSVRWDGAGYNGGSFTRINTDHCVSPGIFYTSRAVTIGSNFGHIWRPSQSPGGKTVFTVIGLKATTPYLFPGSTLCKVHINPIVLVRSDTSETSGSYSVYVDWGKIPYNTSFVGATLDHQSLFVDSAYKASAGLTRAGTSKIGIGYDKTKVPATTVYSYGANTTRYTGAVDPNAEPHPRYFYRRAVIIKIN